MTDRYRPDPVERLELTRQDLAIATLAGRYVERRERDQTPCVHDLLAIAGKFGAPPSTSCAPCSPSTRRRARPRTPFADRPARHPMLPNNNGRSHMPSQRRSDGSLESLR
jgi:hypothetical protein